MKLVDGQAVKPDLKFIGVFSYAEIAKLNHIENPNAWIQVLDHVPDHDPLNSEDKRIAKELYSANFGISIEFFPQNSSQLMEEFEEENSVLIGKESLHTNCKSARVSTAKQLKFS